jgi:thiol-disulfide isomerase/thioredoxin
VVLDFSNGGGDRKSGRISNRGKCDILTSNKKAVHFYNKASFASISQKIYEMSQTVSIASGAQFGALLKSSNIVITDCIFAPLKTKSQIWMLISFFAVYADWCGPCKQISPIFEGLSAKHSKKNSVTFTKVNVDNQQGIAQQYGVTA